MGDRTAPLQMFLKCQEIIAHASGCTVVGGDLLLLMKRSLHSVANKLSLERCSVVKDPSALPEVPRSVPSTHIRQPEMSGNSRSREV